MEYSDYQKAIFDWVRNGSGNGCVNAVAGSGKTKTAVDSVGVIPTFYSVRMNAFNRSIKEALVGRVTRKNVEIDTYNGFGWKLCLRAFGHIELVEKKTENVFRTVVGNEAEYYKYKYMMKKLVSLSKGNCRMTMDGAVLGLDDLIDHHALEVGEVVRFKELFGEVYGKCLGMRNVMDFDDQIFMPLLHGLSVPQTDYLFVDEYQDTNLMQSTLMERGCRDGRMIVIGDPEQSIYGFRGTTPDSMAEFVACHKAKALPLNICYRCPVAAVKNAQKYVPWIEPWSEARAGLVDTLRKVEWKKRVDIDAMILCRCTAPLVASCLGFIRDKRAAFVRGKELGSQIIDLISRVCKDQDDLVTDFMIKLSEWVTMRMEQLEKLEKDSEISVLEDKKATIDALVDTDVVRVVDLVRKIDEVFREDGIGIEHMTIHKAKGLESRGDVFSLPYKIRPPKRDWMILEERRLKYVEATRTTQNHFYVEG